MAKAKVLIATPTSTMLVSRTAAWREATSYKAVTNEEFDGLPAIAEGRPVDYVRNGFCRMFLQMPDITHLFLLDSDVEPPLDCIERLLALNVPLATGCYPVLMQHGLRWALSNMHEDRRYRLLERLDSETEPFEVDAGGAGCLMIRRDVIEKIKWPWFRWIENEDGSQVSEDIFFFKKCNFAGLRVTVDPQVICNHYKLTNLTALMRAKMKNRKDSQCG